MQWPPAQKSPSKVELNHFSGGGGRWRKNPESGSPTATNRVHISQAALKVLGPDARGARGIVATCQVQKPSTQQRISQTPDSVIVVACEKVAKLEKVVEVLQGSIGAEVDAIRIALDRTRIAAQEKPLTEQIADCKGFIERAQRRLVKLDGGRSGRQCNVHCPSKFFGNPLFGQRSHTC